MGWADGPVLAEPWAQDGEGPGGPAVPEQKAGEFMHQPSNHPLT